MFLILSNSHVSDLRIRLKKRAEAPVALTLVRRDGSVTLGRIGGAEGYGPVHDLGHYVVEQMLGIPDAFLGLTAAGWSLEAFERDAADRVPDAAVWAECWAGELSREVLAGQPLDAAEFNATVADAVSRTRPHAPPPPITAEQLEAMRMALEALWAEWKALPVGETMECAFHAGRASDALTRHFGPT